MKISRLIRLVQELTPNAFSQDVLLLWLSNCENSILTDIFLVRPEETKEYEEVTDAQLLVPHPYDKLYLPYMQAQIAHANEEYDLYANLMALYNAYRYEYAQYIVRGADPGSGNAVARGYFLSAYGIATAHGYAGTEEEWLASLKGAKGDTGERGVDGKSAYEIALDEGFEGTEAEWIESLKGTEGRTKITAAAAEDGISYTAVATGLVVEQGKEIVLTPLGTNQGASTLAINGGEAYPLCLRPGWNVTGNDLRPQLTVPMAAGMLLRGAEYIFRFDGGAWIQQSHTTSKDAEDARLLAEDAEQAATTAIMMGNHIIRAGTKDGVSYVAPKSATLPAIAVGSGGTSKGKGTRIVLIPAGKNATATPTLQIGEGEVIPIRLRSAANKGDNDQIPDATDDIPVGALMVGVPYAMTFCGKYWLIDSLIGGVGGGKTYVSDTQPAEMKPGDTWVDTSVELEAPVTEPQMEAFVEKSISAIDVTDTVMEWMMDEEVQKLSLPLQLLHLAVAIYSKYEPGNYVAFNGIGKFETYYSENFSVGGIRVKFQNSTAALYIDELDQWNGFIFYCDATTQEMLVLAAGSPVAFGPTGIAEPTVDSGAANKKYVDDTITAKLNAIAVAEEGSY